MDFENTNSLILPVLDPKTARISDRSTKISKLIIV